MSFKRMLDRRLMLMILAPIARALLSLAVGYLAAVGVPANLLDQLVAAGGVVSMVIFNITWELIDRRKYGVAPMLGSIITAGAGLLGSIFGKKKQTTTSTVDYVQMAANATKAGFNPLTAIRNGGSAGFTTTTSPTVSQLPQALASLGGALGDAYEKRTDPLAAKQRQVDTALVDYQLRQLKEGPKAMPGRLYPGGTFEGTKVTTSKPRGDGFIGPNLKREIAPYLEEGKLTNTDPWRWSGGWGEASPNRTDAAQYEDAYGEVLGSLAGAIPLFQDAKHNAGRVWDWAVQRDKANFAKFKADRYAKRRPGGGVGGGGW